MDHNNFIYMGKSLYGTRGEKKGNDSFMHSRRLHWTERGAFYISIIILKIILRKTVNHIGTTNLIII